MILNDFLLIDELKHGYGQFVLDKPAPRRTLEALSDEAASDSKRVLMPAATTYLRVSVATHIPPFREAAWYQGGPSADD